jgi:hypothetical protein
MSQSFIDLLKSLPEPPSGEGSKYKLHHVVGDLFQCKSQNPTGGFNFIGKDKALV